MTDLLFGWTLGIITVIIPILLWKIFVLQRHVRFLVHPVEQVERKSFWKKLFKS